MPSTSSSVSDDDELGEIDRASSCRRGNRRRHIDNDEVPSVENLEKKKKTFISRSSNPLHSSTKAKNNTLPGPGSLVSKLMKDGGPIMAAVAKMTATRAGMIQPPYAHILDEKSIELLGMICKSEGLQTSGLIHMLLDLVLLLLPKTAYFDNQLGQEINMNFLRVYVGETCAHKSRLIKFCLQTAAEFLKEVGSDMGVFHGDFTKCDLLREMTERVDKILLIIDDEIGLKFRKLKRTVGNHYDSTRISLNVLTDGDGLEATRDEFLDDPCKFALVGASQVLPFLEFLQQELISGCAMTKRFDFVHLIVGNESGDFGANLIGLGLKKLIRGMVYLISTIKHIGDIDRYFYDDEAMPFYREYNSEKLEMERNVNEKNIMECLYEQVDQERFETVDENNKKFRHDKNVMLKSVALKYLYHVFDTAIEKKTFFAYESRMDHAVNKRCLQNAIIIQESINEQHDEVQLTMEALENVAASRISLKEADAFIRFNYNPFCIAKEVLKCPGWFAPVEYIVRLKRRYKVKPIEIVCMMKSLTMPFGSFDCCGTFIDFAKCRVFIKLHPAFMRPEFLLQIGMSIEQYEAIFYMESTESFRNCFVKRKWERYVYALSKLYPNYAPGVRWFERFRNKLVGQSGLKVINLKRLSPPCKPMFQVDRKELLTCERIRGLEQPTLKERIERGHLRLDWFEVIRKTIKHDYHVTKSALTNRRNRRIRAVTLAEDEDPTLERDLRKYDKKIIKYANKGNDGLLKLATYRTGQEQALEELKHLKDQQENVLEENDLFPFELPVLSSDRESMLVSQIGGPSISSQGVGETPGL